jgi:hypothetical protein
MAASRARAPPPTAERRAPRGWQRLGTARGIKRGERRPAPRHCRRGRPARADRPRGRRPPPCRSPSGCTSGRRSGSPPALGEEQVLDDRQRCSTSWGCRWSRPTGAPSCRSSLVESGRACAAPRSLPSILGTIVPPLRETSRGPSGSSGLGIPHPQQLPDLRASHRVALRRSLEAARDPGKRLLRTHPPPRGVVARCPPFLPHRATGAELP